MQINFEPFTKITLRCLKTNEELRQACGKGPSHTDLSIVMYIGRDFIRCVALNCRTSWVSECVSPSSWVCQQLGGISVKLHLRPLPLMEELVQAKTTWLLQSQSLWFLHTLSDSYLP